MGQALLPVVVWAVFALAMFFVAVTAYQAIERDESMEFGWLSEEDLRTLRNERAPIDIPILRPTDNPGGNKPGEGDDEPNPSDQPGEGGEPSVVAPRGLKLGPDRREWALRVDATGGNDRKKTAISRGLAWLTRQQHTDGHWEFSDEEFFPGGSGWPTWETHTGATGLALLAFLGAGNTPDAGQYSEAVDRGVKWLLRQQKSNGDFFEFRDLGRYPHFFAHSVATIAVCEALALSGDESLREPAEKAVQFLVDSQHPSKGGWGYMPLNDEKAEAYTWVTGWGLMALFTARSAGVEVDDEAFRRASRFIDSVMADAGAAYKNRPENVPSPSLTGQGLLARQYLGWERDHPALRNGVERLLSAEEKPEWAPGERDLYGWYFEAQVLHNMGGEESEQWYAHLQNLVLDNQAGGPRSRGKDTNGSWHPEPSGPRFDVMDDYFGRLYSTSMALLILETPFRHMPVYPPED